MRKTEFYNFLSYKRNQSIVTKANWEKGVYNSLRKREKRKCARAGCEKIFEVKPSDSKKFCSRNCAAKVNNSKQSNITSYKKKKIARLYKKGFSMAEISEKLGCGYKTVVYWMQEQNIPRRSRSEANYLKYNPEGDPFEVKENLTKEERQLKGLGLGLYWGEGNKASKTAVRLANSDPKLIGLFREFLLKICAVKEEKFKYSLLLFNDADENKAIRFWTRNLDINKEQIRSVTHIKPRGKGTYKKKSMTGVLIIEFHNTKLKRRLDEMIGKL